ncbi:MAG: DNA translocase FtsK, partial [Candidatus Limnocylindrales bacterium]
GLEVPNGQTTLVSLRQIVESSAFQKLRLKTRLTVALGEDVSGQAVAADLAKMPHLLIAGATGSGKSVCVNAIISCLLLQATPEEVRLILVDPKRVELTTYNDVPHLLRPVVVDVDKVVGVLKWVVHEMDDRYKLFEVHGVRNIEGYNRLAGTRAGLNQLPYIVVVIDELADLMMLAPDETERLLCRLAQLARATGIHLVVATQRPSVDVITGLIKANFPTRISFAVTSQIDSRTILDTPGAEKLLGRGDMLFMPTDAAKPVRLQGVFVSDEEIEALVQHWQDLGPPNYVDQLVHAPSTSEATEATDDLYAKAEEVAREHTRISTSLLQRRLRIGYSRAARLIDTLEQRGVVGPAEGGGRSREVHHEPVDLAEPTVPHLES